MKDNHSGENRTSPTFIRRADYMALPPHERAHYRPVNPRYERIPVACFVIYGLSVVCLILYILQRSLPAFADFFNRYISSLGRALFAFVTGWIPFSVAECCLILIPLILVLTVRYASKYRCDTWRCVAVFLAIILSFALSIGCIFVLNFSAGYYGSPLSDKLDLDTENIQDDELYGTAYYLAAHLNELSEQIDYGVDGFSDMPYSVSDMNQHLMDGYAVIEQDAPYIPTLRSRVKPVFLSEGMSYLHITGVYSFFTGEANINTAFPDFTVPYTAAHELAHQRGIAREDEANFIAFLVCLDSADPYAQYSGYLNMFQYVGTAIYRLDPNEYRTLYYSLSPAVRKELGAYGEFFSKYENSAAGHVSGAINDAYLQSQGTPGNISYDLVTRLMVGYYRDLPVQAH